MDRVEVSYPYRLQKLNILRQMRASREEHGFNTEHVQKKIEENRPVVVFLDTEKGVAEVAKAIASGHPVVTDYGATYGTAFPLGIRQEIAKVRLEQEPLAVVSLVCSKEDALKWMNTSKMHPAILKAVENGCLDIIAGVSFIRFPCTDEALKELGPEYVNHEQEVQVFIVENDPIMNYLAFHHDIHFIAVRSSNITGKPEEPFVKGAEVYANEIGSPIVAVRSKEAYQAQLDDESIVTSDDLADKLQRKRVGSQPILVFKTDANGNPVIELARAGNTTPETMQRLLKEYLGEITFEYHEEKQPAHKRKMFEVSSEITDPAEIKRAILQASLLS
jgi:hypothetical protein